MRSIISKLMLLFISTLFVFSGNITAGENPAGPTDAGLQKLSAEWQLEREVDGLQVYLKRVECNDVMNGTYKEYVLVKLVNTTAYEMQASWDMELWYDGNCLTCDRKDSEYHYVVDVPAGEVREGECGLDSIAELQIFLRYLNYENIAKLTKYNFADFHVNPR